MSLLSSVFRALTGSKLKAGPAMTVKFDSKPVNKEVRAELRKNIQNIPEIDDDHFDAVYNAALKSIQAGRNLGVRNQALLQMKIKGVDKARAKEITTQLHSRATSTMNTDKARAIGVVHATWVYSGAPCMINPRKPSAADFRQNKSHQAADGQRFELGKGLKIEGRWLMPGTEPGCRCAYRSIIPSLTQR